MLLDFYDLREQPFGVTPDPRFLYLSSSHKEALASLVYGVEEGRGFASLIAPPGLGKTTLLFELMDQFREVVTPVLLFQSISTPQELLRVILFHLGAKKLGADLTLLQLMLNKILIEKSRAGKPVLVVIDEAQNLSTAVLEQIRMLSNFETPRKKLIHIILTGQPQLSQRLLSAELIQLRQRLSVMATLQTLTVKETALYIDHRIRAAGRTHTDGIFTDRALALIAAQSGGVPRNINNLCFNALSLGYVFKRSTIDDLILREVIRDLGKMVDTQTLELTIATDTGETPVQSTRPRSYVDYFFRASRVALASAILLSISGASGSHKTTPTEIHTGSGTGRLSQQLSSQRVLCGSAAIGSTQSYQ